MPSTPERTCVGCRSRAPKAALVRIVSVDGKPVLDRDARMPGRGAYLHPRADCVEQALRAGAVGRALRATMLAEELSNLLEEIKAPTKGTATE